MRLTALVLCAACTAPIFAEDIIPAPAPAPVPTPAAAIVAPGDNKAAMKELDNKLKAMRDAAVKEDPDLTKLKAEADDARKHYETAVELKLKDNADYQATKAKLDEMKGKRKGDQKKDAAPAPAAPPADLPKGDQPKL